MHQNASPHNNWTCIWVNNNNNSLTWKVRPFRDDSPIKTMITVRSRREVVSKFTQMYLLLILLSLEMRGRTQERTMAVRFLAGKPPKLFSSNTFGRILSCRPVFGEEEVDVIWCDDWPIFPWVEGKKIVGSRKHDDMDAYIVLSKTQYPVICSHVNKDPVTRNT